ncbi:MAG: 50S ribosomal protein L5 [Verrucomicrobia bacterium]|nr:50S ribosomal protein L5 [Verrucomicrobiota bacterium]MBU6446027.1 50S ribosomal protein L5 [Verrucomicrobiota bacterium]MDE3046761.1 50S ribosomal protein L5 [Verrucomicrobiota bacterium]
MSRLYARFKKELAPQHKARHPNRSAMELPVLKKIVISMGLGDALKDKNALGEHSEELMMLSGQKPIVTKTKKAISNFKLREDQPVGLVVTLRGKRMYDFFDRFCNIVAPRIRDFRGFNKKGDGRGSYSFGLTDQQIFPEINLDKVKRTQGMNVTMVTSAQNDEDCIELLTLLGFPFK